MIAYTPAELLLRERYACLAKIFVDHPHFTPVYRRIRSCVVLGGTAQEVPCKQLTGHPGVGKSTIRWKLRRDFPRRKNACRIKLPHQPVARCDEVPFLHITMPDTPTVKSIVRAGLKAFRDDKWDQRTEEPLLTDRFYRYVSASNSLAILIDDAHYAVDDGGVVVASHIAAWLTALHNELQVSIILAGLGRTKHLFAKDLQLARRWDAPLRLEPYRWIAEGGEPHVDQDAFIAILRSFRDGSPVPFEDRVDLDDDTVAYRFMFASRGLIGLVKKILANAIRLITEQDRPAVITLPLLEQAYDEGVRGELRLPQNAFAASFVPNLGVEPPPLDDDNLLLLPPEVRRRRRSRSARNDEARAALRKG
jgi:hypothetical protein